MLTFNAKTQTVTIRGQEFTLEFFQSVQAPLLIEALGWSAQVLVNQMEANEIPLGQFARMGKVQNFLIEREEQRAIAQKEADERAYNEFYNSSEQVAIRERDAAKLHAYRMEQGRLMRGGAVAHRSAHRGPSSDTIIADFCD